MNRQKTLVFTSLAALLLFGAWWISSGPNGSSDPYLQPTESVLTPAVRERTPHANFEASQRVDPFDDESALTERVVVHVECIPSDADVRWTAELYHEPTVLIPRQIISTQSAGGSQTFEWAAPASAVGIRLVSSHAIGDTWTELDLAIDDAAAGNPHEVTLRLTADARVRGRVTDQQGAPVQGARVLLAPSTDLPHAALGPFESVPEFMRPALSAETDAAGAYVIERVDGRRTYSGAVAHPSHAVAREYGVAPPAGGEVVLDFVVRDGGQVRGRLVDTELRPVAGASLRMAMATRPSPLVVKWQDEGSSTTGADGRFAFGALAPGWKKIQTVVSAEPGLSVAGSWELDMNRGDDQDLGDLIVGHGTFEARISTPEGAARRPGASVRFFAATDSETGRPAALFRIPVSPDEHGVVRIHGLGAGRVSATVNEDVALTAGWYRPRSDFDTYHDGESTTVDWVMNALVNGETPVEAANRTISKVALTFRDRPGRDLAFIWLDGQLTAIGAARSGGLSVEAQDGTRVRFAVTDGDRYMEEEFELTEDVERTKFAPGGRAGYELTVRVEDDGRGVPGVYIRAGLVGSDMFGSEVGRTDGSGVLRLRGLPPGLALTLSAVIGRSITEPVPVKWAGGKAEVVLDASEN